MFVFAECGLGALIRECKSIKQGYRQILKEVGTMQGIQVIRKATPDDINHIRSMGGWLPEKLRQKESE